MGWTRRLRLMMRHTWLIALAIVLACAGIVGVVYYFLSLPAHLKIAVGPTNSEDVRVVQAIAQQLARDGAKVRLRVIVKENGTREAKAAIDSHEVDLAIVRRDIGLPKDGQAVAVWRKNVAVFIVPEPEPAKATSAPAAKGKKKATAAKAAKAEETSKIEKIEQLVGKRLGVIGSTSANIDLLKVVLSQYRVPSDKILMVTPANDTKARTPDKITVIQLPTTNIGPSIREAKVDAILAVGPASSSITADAITAATRDKEPPTFLDINAAEAIAERHPIYEATEIKAGTFGPARPAESIDTIGVNHYLVAHKKLSDDVVADFAKALFAIRQALAAEVPSTAKIEKPDTDKDASVQVHPGAAAYFDGELKSFFERYSDFLYWGLMIISFFGSAMAGLASYSRSDDRTKRLQALERLLELTKSAREAESIAKLDQVQQEVDRVLAEMVHEVENDELDEAALSAFSVMVDQTQKAIAERRATLAEQPPRARVAVASL